MSSRTTGLLLAAVLAATPSLAQTVPHAVTIDALQNFPTFYSDRAVTVRGQIGDSERGLTFSDGNGHFVLAVVHADGRPQGLVEATGQLLDLGRLKQDDPRLNGYDVAALAKAGGRDWPRPGDVFVFAVSRFAAAESAAVNTIRSIVLEGSHASGRLVTVTGQFRARNLFGDLPRAPGISRWDFVLRASEAAIWVTGMQPRGKDFELDPDKRLDTDRWLRVTGIIREGHGLMWIEARSVALAEREGTGTSGDAAPANPPPPPLPPAEVLFSVPAQDETDVNPATTVRIQISRDLDIDSLRGHVRVFYAGATADQPPVPAFRIEMDQRERVLTVRFAQPLDHWRTVRVELLDGIVGTDKQALRPWSVTFTVGG